MYVCIYEPAWVGMYTSMYIRLTVFLYTKVQYLYVRSSSSSLYNKDLYNIVAE